MLYVCIDGSFLCCREQTNAPSSSGSKSDRSLSNAAAGGIGVAVTVAVVELFGLVLWVLRRKTSKDVATRTDVGCEKNMSDSGSNASWLGTRSAISNVASQRQRRSTPTVANV